MSHPLGLERRYEPCGENPQTLSAESRNATSDGSPQMGEVLDAPAPHIPSGYRRTATGVMPEDWESLSVHRIASSKPNSIVGGPFGSELVSKDYVAHGIPVIRGQNMSGRWVSGDFVFVTPAKARALEANLAYPGDIVFTQRGTLGQVSLVPEKPFRAYVVSQSQMKLSVDLSVADPLYIFYFFESHEQQKSIQRSAIQTGVPHINLGILRALPVRVPPLPQQRAIAAVLSDVDGLIGSLEVLIEKKRAIKRAAMQQLLTGRTRLPGFSGEWETRTLGDHLRFLRHGSFPRSYLAHNGRGGGGVKYLHYGDIHTSERVCLDPTATALPTLAKGRARRLDRLSDGDLVFVDASEDIGSVGKSVEIMGNEGHQLVSGLHTIAVRFNKAVLADGFKAYLQFCPRFRDHLRRLAAGTKVYATNRAHIASAELRVPPLPEQRAIAAVLSDMDDEIAALERRLDKTRSLKQGMMQQLLTGAVRLPIPDDGLEAESHDA